MPGVLPTTEGILSLLNNPPTELEGHEALKRSKYGFLDGRVFNPVYQFEHDKPWITRVLQILLQVYGWYLPQRPIFVHCFEDAEAVRRPKVTNGDHSVLVQKSVCFF